MSMMMTTRSNVLRAGDRPAVLPSPAANAEHRRLRVAPAEPEQHVLTVEFRSPEGRRWNAIGGGDTVADAIAWARESCPDGVTWIADSWNSLYGE